MNKLLFFIVFFFFAVTYSMVYNQAFSQISIDDECDFDIKNKNLEKQPWFGNNEYLYDLLSENGYFLSEIGFNNILYRVPVKFWIYDNQKDTGNVSDEEIKKYMTELNYFNTLNKTGFIYYVRDVERIKKTRHKTMGYYFEAFTLSLFRKTKGCINVHIADDIVKKKLFKKNTRVKGTHNKLTKGVFIKRISSSSTLAHEIGHFFGLLHPHRNYDKGKCKQEAVSRSRKYHGCLKHGLICEKSGDGLCDTPAEPNLKKYTNQDCEYFGDTKYLLNNKILKELDKVGLPDTIQAQLKILRYKSFFKEAKFNNALATTISSDSAKKYNNIIIKAALNNNIAKDNWGDTYKPLTDNIMSYTSNRECRKAFTAGQIGVMLYTAKKKNICGWDTKCIKNEFEYKYQYNFDTYEPDNTKAMASNIKLNSEQIHTFHKIYKNKRKDINDNIDWLKFQLENSTSNIEIKTYSGDFKNPDTKLFLYDANDKLIAEDDNSNDDNYSKITIPNLKQGTYYIKVVQQKDISTPDLGDYRVRLIIDN